MKKIGFILAIVAVVMTSMSMGTAIIMGKTSTIVLMGFFMLANVGCLFLNRDYD